MRAPPDKSGNHYYPGATGTGKSTLALSNVFDAPQPPLLIDRNHTLLEDTGPIVQGRVTRWRLPRAETLADVSRLLYREGKGCVFTPRSKDEFRALCRGIYTEKTGHCTVLIDEWTTWGMHAHWTPDELEEGLRMHAHYWVQTHITTQAPQDVEARIRNCMTNVWAFRNVDANAKKALVQWFPPGPGDPDFGTLPDKCVRIWPKKLNS